MDGGEKTKTFAPPTETFATFGDSDDGPGGGPPPGRLRARKSARRSGVIQRSQRKPRPSACVKPSKLKSAGPISPASSCVGAAGSGAPPLGRRRGAAGWHDDTRLERARFTQRTTAAAAKAGEAKLLLTRLDANEQIALVSALVLSAATGLLVYEPFSEQIRLEILEQMRLEVGIGPDVTGGAAGYPPSNVWKASQVFLCVVIGLNLYAVANLAMQHYYAKKSLWFNDGLRDGEVDGMDCDTMVLFVKRTRKTMRHAVLGVVASVPMLAIAICLLQFRCLDSDQLDCEPHDYVSGVIIAVATLLTAWAMVAQARAYRAEQLAGIAWHVAKEEATQYFQRLHPAIGKKQLMHIVRNMRPVTNQAGETFIVQGESGADCSTMYLVRSGAVLVEVDGKGVSTVYRGGVVGELALNVPVEDAKRYASVTALSFGELSEVEMWSIDRDTYRRYLMQPMMDKRIKYHKFMREAGSRDNPYSVAGLFKDVGDVELHSIAGVLIETQYEDGHVLMRQGEVGDDLFVVVAGEASICIDGLGQVATAKEGSFFGEIGLILDAPRSATIKAVGHVECVVLTREFYMANEGLMKKALVAKAKKIMEDNTAAREKYRQQGGSGGRADIYYYDPPDFELVERDITFAGGPKDARPSMF